MGSAGNNSKIAEKHFPSRNASTRMSLVASYIQARILTLVL